MTKEPIREVGFMEMDLQQVDPSMDSNYGVLNCSNCRCVVFEAASQATVPVIHANVPSTFHRLGVLAGTGEQ